MKRLVTGIKPTGEIHLGNYFAAIKPAVQLQEEYEAFIFVADIHALNSLPDAAQLHKNILEVTKAYLACGLDPEQTTLFQQSRLPHAELAMIIGAQTGMGLLERAHAYKDALAKGNATNFGLFSYPVLMAADILMYQAEVVPVGKDQHQHLEMTREIGEKFNHTYGDTFTLPQALPHNVPVIPGLDGQKMSKSYNNTIGIFELPESIRQKVMKIITDSKTPEEPKDPETCTVFALYKLVANATMTEALRQRYLQGGIAYKEAKEMLADALLTYLKPIQAQKALLDEDEHQVHIILEEGFERAERVAKETMKLVRQRSGLFL